MSVKGIKHNIRSIQSDLAKIKGTTQKAKKFYTEALAEEYRDLLIGEDFPKKVAEEVINRVMALDPLFTRDDPTRPAKWEQALEDEVYDSVYLSIQSIKASGDGEITGYIEYIREDDFFQEPDSNTDQEPMRWMYYFIHGGLEDDLYWVPKAAAEAMNGKYLGRFDKGFLIQDPSGETAKRINAWLRKQNIGKGTKFLVKKHPQSGAPASLNFENLADIDKSRILKKAKRRAKKKTKQYLSREIKRTVKNKK